MSEPATVVCVLGPPRSGTSLTIKLMSFLGVHLGTENHLERGTRINRKGSWEHIPIRQLNSRILSHFGGGWSHPPVLPPQWHSRPEFHHLNSRLLEQAHGIIDGEFAGAPLWGWKDPKTCFTLPFWDQVAPGTRCVICVRHPLEVAESIERFSGYPVGQGLYLWLAFLEAAIRHSEGHARLFLSFEDLITDWRTSCDRLAEFIGSKARTGPSLESDAAIADFVDPALWRNRMSRLKCIPLSSAARSALHTVYETLKAHDDDWNATDHETFGAALEVIKPEADLQEAARIERGEAETAKWNADLRQIVSLFAATASPDGGLILVEEGQWGSEVLAEYGAIPFLEHDGNYWGPPKDDETAIQEFERLRERGAKFIVFAWPALWQLDYYTRFAGYLRSRFSCVLESERVVAFDLR